MKKLGTTDSGLIWTLPDWVYLGLSLNSSLPTLFLTFLTLVSYQNFFRIFIWVFFLVVYSQAGPHYFGTVLVTIIDVGLSP